MQQFFSMATCIIVAVIIIAPFSYKFKAAISPMWTHYIVHSTLLVHVISN